MRTYLQITRSYGSNSVEKRMRLEGDPAARKAAVIVEVQNAMHPHDWIEFARFDLDENMAHLFGYSVGTIGYASGGHPEMIETRQ